MMIAIIEWIGGVFTFAVFLWVIIMIAHFYEPVKTPQRTVPKKQRIPIPQYVKREVWRRDGGRCVECNSNEKLEFDHIIPFSKGGSDTIRNLQLLCQRCNRSKGASI